MNADANSQEFENTIQGDDFDFDFDEDFETETTAEYSVMNAMRFDREAGTASCNFELDEDDEADPMKAAGRPEETPSGQTGGKNGKPKARGKSKKS